MDLHHKAATEAFAIGPAPAKKSRKSKPNLSDRFVARTSAHKRSHQSNEWNRAANMSDDDDFCNCVSEADRVNASRFSHIGSCGISSKVMSCDEFSLGNDSFGFQLRFRDEVSLHAIALRIKIL